MNVKLIHVIGLGLIMLFVINPKISRAQTEMDALMMGKGKLCIAGTYATNSWENYWEGTFKRDNANIGRLSTQTAALMLNYGLKDNFNIMATLPYMSTKASRGTLSGLQGFQDISFFAKWRPIKKQVGKQFFSFFAVAGYSTPSNDYNIDFMPMAIGLGSQVLNGRLTADYKINKLFATISAGYMHRGNVSLDRSAYYTDRQINSSSVKMPNAGSFQFRTGYRNSRAFAEAFVDNLTSFGGFDIRKNDMPFVGNRMNSTKVGLEGKYYLSSLPSLGFHANAWTTVAGRNMGQATGFLAGVDYIIDLKFKSLKK